MKYIETIIRNLALSLAIISYGLFSSLDIHAQGIADVGIIWEKESTMPITQTRGITSQALSNGNYLIWGYQTSQFSGNINELYMVEYTEAGSVVRQQTITIPVPNTGGRTWIGHTRFMEIPNNKLLMLVEFSDGPKDPNVPETMIKTILSPNDTAGYQGKPGWSYDNLNFHGLSFENHSGYDKIHVGRTLGLVRVDDNLIAVAATAIGFKGAALTPSRVSGILYIDNNGNIANDPHWSSKNSKFKILDTTSGDQQQILEIIMADYYFLLN